MRDILTSNLDILFTNKTPHMSLLYIQQRGIMLLNLNRIVNKLLPVPLRFWCRVANIHQSVMVIEIANASWKLRFLYEQHQLLSALKKQILPSLSSINIKINPDLDKKKERSIQNTEKKRHLSVQSAAYISNVAKKISQKKLKNALERLTKLSIESTDSFC
ncbi:Uncharacterized protein TRABTM_A_00650 [secondary endosymbiont of Trabutina mannipara]|uniref:DUF721 domain-containing protein n=1 Tax=secondary endosymbiont of Trabutina mannipara TaxID=1835721 RepID=A0A1C3L3R3_9ENTR|nr:DciA family protein [secondary endosymbiont of Trabutina mannipara]SBT81930.1 Uncharacterized protein TRABTM_A_00650 [secondary endosymbiont of Trabutina mannipara]